MNKGRIVLKDGRELEAIDIKFIDNKVEFITYQPFFDGVIEFPAAKDISEIESIHFHKE